MKSELIIQDFGGEHNKDMAKTSARLMKGASWKRQRIVVVLPADALISAKVALSHWNLIFPPNNGVCRILAQGMEVGDAYSKAIEGILAHPELSKWEFILTLEHDNMPPQNGVVQLVEQLETHPELDCVGGLYFTKGECGVAQIWGDPHDPQINFRPQLPDLNGGLVECCGTGMGFNLFRLAMFKDEKLRKPWFVTQKKDGCSTQDLYFWQNARMYGHRCAIDCSVKVGHYSVAEDVVW